MIWPLHSSQSNSKYVDPKAGCFITYSGSPLLQPSSSLFSFVSFKSLRLKPHQVEHFIFFTFAYYTTLLYVFARVPTPPQCECQKGRTRGLFIFTSLYALLFKQCLAQRNEKKRETLQMTFGTNHFPFPK